MQTVQVGEFKARFSEMIDAVRAGETVIVSYGRSHEIVAALVPIDQLTQRPPRQLGVLAGQLCVTLHDDFAMTEEELLGA